MPKTTHAELLSDLSEAPVGQINAPVRWYRKKWRLVRPDGTLAPLHYKLKRGKQ